MRESVRMRRRVRVRAGGRKTKEVADKVKERREKLFGMVVEGSAEIVADPNVDGTSNSVEKVVVSSGHDGEEHKDGVQDDQDHPNHKVPERVIGLFLAHILSVCCHQPIDPKRKQQTIVVLLMKRH